MYVQASNATYRTYYVFVSKLHRGYTMPRDKEKDVQCTGDRLATQHHCFQQFVVPSSGSTTLTSTRTAGHHLRCALSVVTAFTRSSAPKMLRASSPTDAVQRAICNISVTRDEITKGYGRRRIQYELWDRRTGSCMPVTKTGQGLGAGCTRGLSVTLTGAFGVTMWIRMSCAINCFEFLSTWKILFSPSSPIAQT